MAQQTAVEFLVNELESILELYNSEWDEVYKAAEQAKAMEKEQIIKAHGTKVSRTIKQGIDIYETISGEKYYNETYNK